VIGGERMTYKTYISTSDIKERAKKWGLPYSPKKYTAVTFSSNAPIVKDEFIDALLSALSTRELIKDFNLNHKPMVILRWLRDLGLPKPKRKVLRKRHPPINPQLVGQEDVQIDWCSAKRESLYVMYRRPALLGLTAIAVAKVPELRVLFVDLTYARESTELLEPALVRVARLLGKKTLIVRVDKYLSTSTRKTVASTVLARTGVRIVWVYYTLGHGWDEIPKRLRDRRRPPEFKLRIEQVFSRVANAVYQRKSEVVERYLKGIVKSTASERLDELTRLIFCDELARKLGSSTYISAREILREIARIIQKKKEKKKRIAVKAIAK